MKKNLLLAAAALVSTTAMADSYTISFLDSGAGKDASNLIKTDTELSTFVDEGADYINSIAIGPSGTTTSAYLGKTGYGLKFGSSSKPGNLVFRLNAKGAIEADSVIIKAAAWVSTAAEKPIDTPHATFNGTEYAITSTDTLLANYKIVFETATQLDSIYLSGTATGRYYVKSVTVYYTAAESSFDATLAHSPRYAEGKLYENVLGPDMVATKVKTVDGVAQDKYGIADRYQWIEYINPTSTLDDGTGEVQTSNRWTNYDPSYDDYNYGEGSNWIQVKNAAGSAISPVLSSAWGKYMTIYVKDVQRIEILGIGSASGSAEDGNNIQVVATAQDNSEILEFASTPGAIYGKGTASDTCVVKLNPEKAYKVVIKGNETVQKDIMVGNIRLYGSSTVAGPAIKNVEATYAYWDVVTGPDMVVKGGTKVKTAEDQTVAEKWGIDDNYKWIEYINPTSTLDDGTAEVQTSNRWTDINPRTGLKGEWIQVKGADGDVNAPVLSSAWGKYIKFYVTGTKKFTVYGAGSASGSAADGNRLIIEAYAFNSNNVLTAATEAGTIYGKGTASDFVSIELDETETYEIIVKGDETVQKDIQLLGINLLNSDGEANQLANKGTLNIAIEKALTANATSLTLDAGETYTLNGIADLGRTSFSLIGDNTNIVTDANGQITTKFGFVIDGVNIDASASTIAPLAMADKSTLTAADTAALYTYGVQYGTAAVYYTQDECDAFNNENTAAIEAGTVEALTTSSVKTAAVEDYKYANASNKVLEGDTIIVRNSTIKVGGSSFITGGNAAWALKALTVDNSIVEISAKSGKAIINWEEGASQIKDITINNSTFFADSANTDMRFHRYSAQVDPWRIWGYEGEDKNLPGLNTWTLTNSTFVNVCGNKEFSNNMKNTAATTLTFKGNIFANTWRLQKLGTNLTFNFDASENAIFGGVNDVDNTDATKFATIDSLMGIGCNNESNNFVPSQFSNAAKDQLGDPRWLEGVVYINPTDSLNTLIAKASALLTAPDANTTLEEYATLSTEKATAEGLSYATTIVAEMPVLSNAIEAYEKALAEALGIETIANIENGNSQTFDLNGRVAGNAKGFSIKNGKVIFVK